MGASFICASVHVRLPNSRSTYLMAVAGVNPAYYFVSRHSGDRQNTVAPTARREFEFGNTTTQHAAPMPHTYPQQYNMYPHETSSLSATDSQLPIGPSVVPFWDYRIGFYI